MFETDRPSDIVIKNLTFLFYINLNLNKSLKILFKY